MNCQLCGKASQRFNLGIGSSLLRNYTEPIGLIKFCSFKHNLIGNRYVNFLIIFVLVGQNLLFPIFGFNNPLDSIHPFLKWIGVFLQSGIAGYGIYGIKKYDEGFLHSQRWNT